MVPRLMRQSVRILTAALTLAGAGAIPVRAQDADAKAAPNRAEGEGPFDKLIIRAEDITAGQ